MEYSLTSSAQSKWIEDSGLNPYSNGILSDSFLKGESEGYDRLNPYSNGILSDTYVPNTLWGKYES